MVLQQSAPIGLSERDRISPPEMPNHSFSNILPFFNKYLHLELHQLAQQYGNIFQIRVGARTFVVLSSLETIREALVKQGDSFNARADFDIYQKPPMRYFMEMKSGDSWSKHRNIAGQVMRSFMVGKSDIHESWMIEESVDLANIFINSNSKPFNPTVYLPLATLSFMQRILFDKRGSLNNPKEDNDFVTTAYNLIQLNKSALDLTKLMSLPVMWRPIYGFYRFKPLLDFVLAVVPIDRYLLKNLEQHRESFNPEKLRDIADGLLNAIGELTDSDRNDLGLSENDIVNGTLMQFAGAGGNIPSLMVRWALLYMIAYPDIQAKIQRELDEVVGREQQPGLRHRGKLPFTEACIHEIFRHSSSTVMPAVIYATSTDTTLEGYFIPQNTPLLINYYGLTRDQSCWEEPEQFNPDRFLDENGKLRNTLAEKFYPFGVGSRRCLGEYLGRFMVFLLFTNLMHKCKFEGVPGDEYTLVPQPGILFTPKDYRVIAKPRF